MNALLAALTRRGYCLDDAREEIAYMVESIHDGADPEELLYDVGLEPDYVFDLLDLAGL